MSTTNDPVTEFLAREQTVLADLGEDFVSQTPPLNVTENGAISGENNLFNGNAGCLTNGGAYLDDLELLNSNCNSNGALDMEGLQQTGINRVQTSPTLSTSRSQSRLPEEEPENIRLWREQQKELLEKKDLNEEKKKEELRQQAKKELEQFYALRKAQLEQRKKSNRERQAAYEAVAKLEEKESNAVMWERVARMIEGSVGSGTTTGSSKAAKLPVQGGSLHGKDTTYMKQLILMYARGELHNDKCPSPETQ